MNELQAAYGLLQLKHLKAGIQKSRKVAEIYDRELKNVKGVRTLRQHPDADHNYSYYPIFVDKKVFGITRDELYNYLKSSNIFGRRYFYPLVSQFPMYRGLDSAKPANLPNASEMAEQVICLPFYPELDLQTASEIVLKIKNYDKGR
jgi:dTDP-4-amino-4,6-dideoxygalactose transaminase